ncbi:MAG: tRNA (adenosine(37)-N6)-threonylcarbamoyltransferase complex ATPase subunit type 1 TsaE [Rickettsiales bacterium]|nr:tRNA (adenosine(37)-N6)-threonylcarbamoyltransferase complex ATPase subunit type 1 TsaE [Rickettsiales bacterium]
MIEEFISNSQEETENFARKFALKIGFQPVAILLKGNLGSGKTAFSRGFIRALTGDENLTIASPTFLISYSYKAKNGLEIRHMDLYRLKKQEEIFDLDIENAFENCITLIEWPEILEGITPKEHIQIQFEYIDENRRKIMISRN